ncbi:MAG: HD-GYP domain-containing protein [Thermodesulfovibrionales bacterium]|nr:HD-GYP domain-containing protein [Thermodesulfovibrionales bacterium]
MEEIKKAIDIISNLAILLRTSQVHDINNIAVQNLTEKVAGIINEFLKEERLLQIDLVGEFFYANDTRLKYSIEHLLNFDFLARELKKRTLGTLIFKERIDPEDIKTFIKAFNTAGFSKDPLKTMFDSMKHIRTITVDRLKRVKEDESVDMRKIVKKTYFNAVSFSRGLMNKIKAKEAVNIKKAKRIVESMVDLILEEEQLFLGMTAIKDYDEYTYHHSVNVSVLAIALGQRLGLSKKALNELGLAALFHDIGKVEVPIEILNKPTAFTEDEWLIMRKHPQWGVKALLSLKAPDPLLVRSAIVAFEHHLHYNYSGYHRIKKKEEQDLYSRIVTIADQYDAMTSSRVYSRVPLPPDKALSILIERSGTQIDPLLLKFFINMVGVYPIGSMVLLNTNELGIVYQSNPAFPERPRVRIIMDSSGKQTDTTVDLTERDSEGRFIRNIVKTLDYTKYRINLAEYLM